jgi:hypothetical protein
MATTTAARLDLRGHLCDHPAAEAVLKPLLAKQGALLGEWLALCSGKLLALIFEQLATPSAFKKDVPT